VLMRIVAHFCENLLFFRVLARSVPIRTLWCTCRLHRILQRPAVAVRSLRPEFAGPWGKGFHCFLITNGCLFCQRRQVRRHGLRIGVERENALQPPGVCW
jgi:hypothetical protein